MDRFGPQVDPSAFNWTPILLSLANEKTKLGGAKIEAGHGFFAAYRPVSRSIAKNLLALRWRFGRSD
jgi:hypothetical protein